ncbi:MAG: hypothetical protein JW904_12710 [Spirochaetales bacterium]|nr:hypothetical protein [Spirochaetales bacterium]
MFENIIGNESTISAIRREILSKEFPQAVLFAGPKYSGKLSTALETARILACEKKAEWPCTCTACIQSKQLLHPYTILCGYRTFAAEIAAAANTLQRVRTPASQHLFVRSIRKLTRRFDAHIFTTEESKRKIIQDCIMKIEDSLDAVSPGRPLAENKLLTKQISEMTGLAGTLEQFVPKDNIPVSQIRNIIQWSFETTASEKKIIIIENASGMLDSSRNALLKILEEPPQHTHFILITPRPDELIATIRSRVRKYRFLPRTHEQTSEILTRVFKEETIDFPSLRDYFLAWEDINAELLGQLVLRFAENILLPKPVILQNALPQLFEKKAPSTLCRTFLEELLIHFRRQLAESPPDQEPALLERFERWTKLLHARYREYATLNISMELFLERLYLELREAV